MEAMGMAWQNKPDVFPWEDAYVALRVVGNAKYAKNRGNFAYFSITLEAISHDSIAKSDDDDALT